MKTKQKILDFFELRDKIEETVRDYVQDTLMPLDDRWEIFEKSGFGEYPCYIQHMESLHDDIVMYEGLIHVDRYQTVSVFDIIKTYEYDMKDNSEYSDQDQWRNYGFDPVAFKEECLAKFLKGWKHDW